MREGRWPGASTARTSTPPTRASTRQAEAEEWLCEALAGYSSARALYWQNFLSLNLTREVSADLMIAEADRLFGDLPIRHVVVADAEAAEHLRPGFLMCGYREAVHVIMVLRRPFDRKPPVAELVELGAAALGPAVEAYMRGVLATRTRCLS